MAQLTLRNVKGSPLTNQELDDNFSNLNTDLSNKLALIGGTLTGNLNLNNSDLNVKGIIKLSGNSSGYVGLSVPANAGSTIYTLPSADGSSGYLLSTNGSGALQWIAQPDTLPNQTGNSGKYLTTNGTTASWSTVTKSDVGLSNVENIALSTWSGSSNITTLGTIANLSASGTVTISGTASFTSTDAILIPVGTIAQRPTGVNGMLRYNSTTTQFEGFANNAWGGIAVGGGGNAYGWFMS